MFIAGAVASPAAACSLSRFGFQPAEVAISHPKLLFSNWRPPVGRPLLPTHGRFSYRRLVLVASAADSTQPSSAAAAKTIVPDNGFSLSKVSFGVIGLAVGGSLLSYGFGAYFTIFPGSEWSAILLTYGFPLTIIGMALKYAELKPVPCITYNDAEALREKCATPILKQVRNDVTRFRYGDEQHLDEALKRIFQYGLICCNGQGSNLGEAEKNALPHDDPLQFPDLPLYKWLWGQLCGAARVTDSPFVAIGGGIPRRSAPFLRMIREEVTEDGKYCLVLVFEAKALKLSDFEQRQAKFTSFFGPGIAAEIGKGGEADFYEVRLISQTTSEPSSQS